MLEAMRSLEPIRVALARRLPRMLPGDQRAAVAVVLLEEASGTELLLIERAERAGDPWSGHMAFPGGRVDPDDRDARATAERETREEVGLDLATAEPIGQLDDLAGGSRMQQTLVLSAFVYRLAARPALIANHEVRETLWVPLGLLLDPARHIDHTWGPTCVPGILVGEPGRHVVWGLTYRFLDGLFATAGHPFPRPTAGR